MECPLSCRPGELPRHQSLRRSLEALQLDFLQLWVNAFLERFIKSLLSARLPAWPCMGSFEINVPQPQGKSSCSASHSCVSASLRRLSLTP